MKKILLSLAALALSLFAAHAAFAQAAAPAAAPAAAARPPQAPRAKVIAFYTAGGEIDHYFFAEQAVRELTARGQAGGYNLVATTDWDDLNDAKLKDVKLVLFLNGLPGSPAQQAAFQRFIEQGGAWLGFHVSGFASNNWPWYRNTFLGGVGFGANNWPSLPARVNVDDTSHPVVKGVPQTFITPINEWYSWNPSPRGNPDIKVLMTLDKSNYPMGVKNTMTSNDAPVAWTNTKFKMVYLNYGHGDRVFTSPALSGMIDNSIAWLLGRNK